MKINLLTIEEDDIGKIYQYPDGQQQVVLKRFPYSDVTIVASLRNWKETGII